MNSIGAIGKVSAIGGVSGISGVSGAGAVSSISGVGGVAGAGGVDGVASGTQSGDSFLNSLNDAFGQLNGQLNAADASMTSFATGGSADLQTVMLQMEEASVGLKTAVQVRDKLLEAYQEIMRTQV
jgi:flagellar hook-basal body complex protein FliE